MLGIIIITTILLYVSAAYYVVKHISNSRYRLFVIMVFVLIPTWDVVIGRAIFYMLCIAQGGVHVYHTVEPGAKYFGENGIPLFYDDNKIFKNMSMGGRYSGATKPKEQVSKMFNIKLSTDYIYDKTHNIELGEIKYFIYYGGWVFNAFNTGGAGGVMCQKPSRQLTMELINKVFVNKAYKRDD